MERDIGKPLFNLFLLIASASAFVAASALPNIEIPGDLSAAFFPKLLSGLVFILAIPCLIKDLQEWRRAGSEGSKAAAVNPVRGIAQWCFAIVLLVAYIYAFERLGYIASTALFTFFCVMGLALISGAWSTLSAAQKGLSLLFALVFSVVLAGAIFYVFTDLFQIPLPT
ncbi:tripartite tricarboxylate transporter TctB family protein [Halomonas aquamarina]|uniref:Tripartite tricarboxylate transporter TctB family protein n=1 Tax=Vreelandella aquamarina TaxID=77097 RepID=A0ACC5VUJ6_9GAMM|nr:tripartite tricarboxylate transporter TctB family protein [Halomonas aquamarina]MBZ5487332.1 tripartite tricarboxylate transporter TctB family protein [Halomonas aquamarina]